MTISKLVIQSEFTAVNILAKLLFFGIYIIVRSYKHIYQELRWQKLKNKYKCFYCVDE